MLCWLKSPIEQLKEFVANRVKKITELVNVANWCYVNTDFNPADLATRGFTATKFLNNHIWVHGPEWLLTSFEDHVNTTFDVLKDLPEMRKVKLKVFQSIIDTSLLSRFSSYS